MRNCVKLGKIRGRWGLFLGSLLFLAGSHVLSASPGASQWVTSENSASRLIAEKTATNEDAIHAGIQIRLHQGWTSYWRNPGDVGNAPKFDWEGSENIKSIKLDWPVPKRQKIFGVETIGYDDDFVLPLRIEREQAGAPVKLHLALYYSVCRDICAAVKAEHDLTISTKGSNGKTLYASLIEQAQERVPTRSTATALQITSALAVKGKNETILEVTARSHQPLLFPEIFVEGAGELQFGAPDWEKLENGRLMIFSLPVYGASNARKLAGEIVRITLADGAGLAIEREVEISITP